MGRWSLAARLVVPATLVALIGLLASLEYRWLDEVSRADLDERRASLHQRADDFAQDVDREVMRLYVMLQSQGPALRRDDAAAFSRAFDAWRNDARDPHILGAIYVVHATGTGDRVSLYDPDRRQFTDAAWPADLASIRANLQPTREPGRGALFFPEAVSSIDAAIPALIVPLPAATVAVGSARSVFFTSDAPAGYAIARLDRDELRSTFLPALLERYFPARDADSYRVAIIDPSNPAHPILSRGFPPGAAIDPKKADATVTLLSMRLDLVSDVTRRAFVTTTARRTSETGTVQGGAAGRGTGRIAGTLAPAPARGTMQIVVESGVATDPGQFKLAVRSQPAGWELVLQHPAGSLDAAVAAARRRNLWLSFGLLALVSAGVVLIVTNAQRSQRLATQQMDFVATVSHELRTPLAVIRSAAQNLATGVVHEPAQARQYGDLIETEGRRLTDMVEQVLEFAGVEAGRRPVARTVEVGTVAREAVTACLALAPGAAPQVDVSIADDLPAVVGDEGAIRRAVQNLVTNAIKYGAAGGWIGLTVRRVASRTGSRDEVQILVSDRGPGVDPADLAHVFEPFYRGRRAMDAQIHGNGLGLSLVARIARAHGGRVTVSSPPGQGATFTISLPAARTAAADAAPATDPAAQAGPSHA